MIVFAVCPIPLLFIAWRTCLKRKELTTPSRLTLLLLATCSHMWLVIGMWLPALLGASYSNIRFAIIDANFVVMLACSISILLIKGTDKVLLAIASIITTALWSLVAAVNVAG